MLVLFEGVDRSGKTTQSALLRDRLAEGGCKVELIRFPDRNTRMGKVIDSYLSSTNGEDDLDDRAIHLLFSANRWEVAQKIKELLLRGVTVIMDRYAHSGAAYTMAKGGFSLEWCCACDRGLPEPDQIFYLDVPVDVAEARGDFGKERYEQSAFQRRVYRAYQDVMERSKNVRIINGAEGVDQIHQMLYGYFCVLSTAFADQKLGKLWEE